MANRFPHLAATLAAHRLFAAAELDPTGWAMLKAAGVDLDHVTNLCGPIVRILASFENGLFAEDTAFGEIVFAMSVCGEDAVTDIDLVAWSSRDPEAFGTMFGSGSLGVDRLHNPASYATSPCRLYATPLTWLRSGCEDGCCVLNFKTARDDLAKAPGLMMPETFEFGDSLIRAGVVRPDRLVVPDRRAA